jgi:hypothetical protein
MVSTDQAALSAAEMKGNSKVARFSDSQRLSRDETPLRKSRERFNQTAFVGKVFRCPSECPFRYTTAFLTHFLLRPQRKLKIWKIFQGFG